MRKLVTIRRIADIKPIPNADNIDVATVDGWKAVIMKDSFMVGEYCLYFETDSFLDASDPRFEFLKKGGTTTVDGYEGIRIKSMRLKKQISQGLIQHIDNFPEALEYLDAIGYTIEQACEEQVDLSEALNVLKYERPEPVAADAAGHFPDWISKSDEERIQNCYEVMKRDYNDVTFYPTLKLDGTSCTIASVTPDIGAYNSNDDAVVTENGVDMIVCSRNLQVKVDNKESHYYKALDAENMFDRLSRMVNDLGRPIAIQGEVMGSGIQGNQEKIMGFRFFAFNIFDIITNEYMNYTEVLELFEKYDINHVPLIEEPFKVFHRYDTLDELIESADGPSLNYKYREGIVFKSKGVEPPISMKIISNRWLIKVED